MRIDSAYGSVIFNIDEDVFVEDGTLYIGTCELDAYESGDACEGYLETAIRSSNDLEKIFPRYEIAVTLNGKTVDYDDFISMVKERIDQVRR